MAITVSVLLHNLPFIKNKINFGCWFLSSFGATSEKQKIFPLTPNTKLLTLSTRAMLISTTLTPPFTWNPCLIWRCAGTRSAELPCSPLSDINLIKMICHSSTANQAKQNDKWEIILWGKKISSPVELAEHLIWLSSPFINTRPVLESNTYVWFARMEPAIITRGWLWRNTKSLFFISPFLLLCFQWSL